MSGEDIGALLPWGEKSFFFTGIDRNHRHAFVFTAHRTSGNITTK